MELIDGPSLAQLVEREGPLPLDRVLRLLREALSALAHAHGSGLVHRDIKPENMLIDPTGSLQITDFGLALALRGRKFGGATSQSGTPQFASPEQLLGERVDQRSDLYSLAAVAYFALLGHAALPGQHAGAGAGAADHQPVPRPARAARRRERGAGAGAGPGAPARTWSSAIPSAAEFLQALNRRGRTRRPGSRWPTGPGRRRGGSAARPLTKRGRHTDLSPRSGPSLTGLTDAT